MKKLIYAFTMTLTVLSCLGQKITGYEQMNPGLWQKDLDYLANQIDREFNSFDPSVKGLFAQEIAKLSSRLESVDNYQMPGEIQRLLSLLNDGHTELNVGHHTVKYHRAPLSLYVFEGEFYVLAAQEPYQALVGSKVAKIEGMPIADAFEKLKANMSRDNEMEYLHAGPGYIILTELLAYLGISKDPLTTTFTFDTKDGLVTQKFKGLTAEEYVNRPWIRLFEPNEQETPLYRSQPGVSYWYQYLPESKAFYFHFGRVNNQKGKPSIRSFSKELMAELDKLKPEKLIIDLRLNNGGNYNLTKPIWEGIKKRDWLNQPGKVWAITGRRTFSAAASFCVFLKRHTKAKLIGEVSRTHPNQADNNEYMTLPNSGFLLEYTTRIKVKWPENPDADRIPVDVTIAPTLEAYRQGRDLVMEYLLKKR